jgi:hypothetical protein
MDGYLNIKNMDGYLDIKTAKMTTRLLIPQYYLLLFIVQELLLLLPDSKPLKLCLIPLGRRAGEGKRGEIRAAQNEMNHV